ncbi:MAG: ribosome small subunit-dependent GTPase A [Leptolyngbya sp. SIO3F4]|nr:ribosome small subunit-dependent GTPase A [Leptolyngbya sp. SIO3F4]
MRGRVYKSTGSWYRVRLEGGDFMDCRILGKMRLQGIRSTNPVAVGDWVQVEQEPGEPTGSIVSIEDRTNYLVRKSTKLSKQVHILAANVDQVVLVTTVVQPKIALGLVNRILVTAEAYDIPALLVFNKYDLYSEPDLDKLAEILAIYHPIGYPYALTSVQEGRGIETLRKQLRGKTSLFAGHSGVGKSSLLNALDPSLELRVKEVSAFNEKGQHTTTFAEMHDLSDDTFVVDTPGVRSFGVFDFNKETLSHYYPEMRERLGQCKFYNCMHIEEPGCAVRAAVEEGEISWARYQSYLNLYYDEDLKTEY